MRRFACSSSSFSDAWQCGQCEESSVARILEWFTWDAAGVDANEDVNGTYGAGRTGVAEGLTRTCRSPHAHTAAMGSGVDRTEGLRTTWDTSHSA